MFPALCLGPTRLLIWLLSGCFQRQAFGTSVDGRRDCKPKPGSVHRVLFSAKTERVVAGTFSPTPIEKVDVPDIFYFFCSGRGKGESEAPGGGGDLFFIEKCQGGAFQDGRGRGAGRVSAASWGILGGRVYGGLSFFFCRGRNGHQAMEKHCSEPVSGKPSQVVKSTPCWSTLIWTLCGLGPSAFLL